MAVRRALGVAVVAALTLAACSHSGAGRSGGASSTTAPRAVPVLVTIGSDATLAQNLPEPIRQSWPQLLYRSAFPLDAVLVNASSRAADVNQAIARQVPLALEVHATVIAVWLGSDDVIAGVSAPVLESRLIDLLRRARSKGARVLVGNLPPYGVPHIAVYNQAIARAAAATGATVVDLNAALRGLPAVGSGSQIDARTSAEVAAAFAAAVART